VRALLHFVAVFIPKSFVSVVVSENAASWYPPQSPDRFARQGGECIPGKCSHSPMGCAAEAVLRLVLVHAFDLIEFQELLTGYMPAEMSAARCNSIVAKAAECR